ncbi:bifunctional DNA primase/polymerase [Pseudonocardia benzenivorans]
MIPGTGSDVLLSTGEVLDVVEVPDELGRRVCATLRARGLVVPVAATTIGTWWFPMTAGFGLPPELSLHADVVLHTDGIGVVAPPSERPDGWVHWRVAPGLTGYSVPDAATVIDAVIAAVRWRASGGDEQPGAQRPAAAVAKGARSRS